MDWDGQGVGEEGEEMTVDEIADIIYMYLKKHPCPMCSGNLRVEVKRRKSGSIHRHLFRVVCRGCGLLVEYDDYAQKDLPENTVSLRGIAAQLREKIRHTNRTIGGEVAKRLMGT